MPTSGSAWGAPSWIVTEQLLCAGCSSWSSGQDSGQTLLPTPRKVTYIPSLSQPDLLGLVDHFIIPAAAERRGAERVPWV